MREWLQDRTRWLNEKTSSTLPRVVVNQLLKGKVQVLNLRIDSKTKTIEAELLPKGQRQPVKLRIENYKIEEDAERTTLSWSSIHIEAGSADLPPGLKEKLEFVL